MTTHRFDPERFFNTMGQHPPALHVQAGDTVVVQTLDALGVDRTGVQRGERPNPQSGPIWMEGAMPGDVVLEVLRVDLLVHVLPGDTDPDLFHRVPGR